MRFKIRRNLFILILNRREIQKMNNGERLEDLLKFGFYPKETICCSIEPSNCDELAACFAADQIRIFVPHQLFYLLGNTEIREIQNTPSQSGQMGIRLEKEYSPIQEHYQNVTKTEDKIIPLRILK